MKNVLLPLDDQTDADLLLVQKVLGKREGRVKVTRPQALYEGIRLLKARYVRAPKPTADAAPEPGKDTQ